MVRRTPRPARATLGAHGALRLGRGAARHVSGATGGGRRNRPRVVRTGGNRRRWPRLRARGGSGCVLRHRHAGHPGSRHEGRVRVPDAGACRPLRSVPLVHRWPDAHSTPARARRPARARVPLLRRSRGICAARRRGAVGARLPRHVRRRPPAGARAAPLRAGTAAPSVELRGRGAAVPAGARVAAERRPHRPSRAPRASRFLRGAALHPQRHPSGHAPGGLVAKRPALRGRRVRRARHLRSVGRDRDLLPAGAGDPDRGRAAPARSPLTRGGTGDRRARASACAGRAHGRASGRRAGGTHRLARAKAAA